MRLAAGLRPDPLGSYGAPPDPLAVIRGREVGEGKGWELGRRGLDWDYGGMRKGRWEGVGRRNRGLGRGRGRCMKGEGIRSWGWKRVSEKEWEGKRTGREEEWQGRGR